jgi:NAD(P)-dependent dehydrogenase (short-subunit alcohol dehydrogenase family)
MSISKGIALVTGSAQGIGRGIALRLADEGYDVALNDISPNKANLSGVAAEIRSKKRKAFEVFADVGSEQQVKSMVQNTVKELGGLDVVRLSLEIIWQHRRH